MPEVWTLSETMVQGDAGNIYQRLNTNTSTLMEYHSRKQHPFLNYETQRSRYLDNRVSVCVGENFGF